ncbi:SLC26A/SulP transporter family protein [Sphingomonas sp. 28-62-11]|uniref:SLC26A/SulP transporter family protein n=1 Tax=Sphingomonas sp. 28-62-11 TaxID=1970432 RepID=UPI0035A9A862
MGESVSVSDEIGAPAMDARERPIGERIYGWLNDIFSGSICGLLSILFGISYAALIFAGPLAPGLSTGLAATFLTTAIAALVVALRSSMPFMIAGPDSSTSAVTAALSAALAHQMITDGVGGGALIGPALMIIAMGSGISGLFLCLLGLARAGRAIRFIPYPVIGGFLGATGVLIVSGSVQVMTDHKFALANIEALTTPQSMAKILAGIAIAATLLVARARFKSAFTLPTVLAGAVALFYVLLAAASVPIADAQAAGWTFARQSPVAISIPWTADALMRFPWAAMPSLLGDMLAVMFVTTISALLNTAGIELATEREANLNRELNALGAANLMSAVIGGYVSCMSLSRSTLAHAAGATGRLAGITVSVIAALMLVVDPAFLAFVPKSVLGGLLLYMGIDLLYRWLVQSARRLMLTDYLSLLAIVAIIFFWGFVFGVIFGIVTGCATFALSASRVNAIKFSFDGRSYRSSLDRGGRDLAILNDNGSELQGMALQSYLFFGSANGLYQHIKGLIAANTNCRFLLFDFRLVTGIDSSATHSFNQIKLLAGRNCVSLVLVNMSEDIRRAFQIGGLLGDDVILGDDLDHALEHCENIIIQRHRAVADDRETFIDWLGTALRDRRFAETLAQHCRRIEVSANALIATQGAPSDSMHFILEGRIGVVVNIGQHRQVRVRSLGEHTTIGEMGLLTQQPRSANIVAEANSVLYELSADSYARLMADHPALTQALLTYVITVMGERLRFASQAIGILQN